MSLIRKFIERFISQIWSESKVLRIFVKTLNSVAIFALVAWIVLSVIAHYRADTAQVFFEKDLTQNTIDSSVDLATNPNAPQTFTYRAKLRFSNPLFRYQRNITHINITQILWSESIDKSAISEVKTTHDRIFEFSTTQDLDTLKSAEMGFVEYKSDFMPLLKTIIFYYILLSFVGFALTILWRYNRTLLKSALILVAFSLVILTIDGAKIEKLNLVPFGIIGICVFGLCVFFAFRAKRTKIKLFLSYFSVVPLCLGIAEFWLFFSQNKAEMTRPHEILGYANSPLYEGRAKLVVDDKIIYDAHYKHDEYGNRITPNNNVNSKKCIAIYGGSFAYGSAVDSDKTLEYFLAQNLPDYKILNFGINGSGAHTALARLEFQIDKKILEKCEEFIAIYEAIPHHIYRAYGAYLGAHYRLDSQGVLRYFGTYKDGEYNHARFYQKNPPKITPRPQEPVRYISIFKKIHNTFKDIVRLQGKFDKSYIKQSLTGKETTLKSEEIVKRWGIGFASNPNYYKVAPNEINLYFAIVKRIQEELNAQYGVPLYIVLWDYDMHAQFLDKYDEVLKANFSKMKVPFYALSEMIEDYPQDLERVKRGDFDNFKYRVSRWDTHSNGLANEKIAEFLAQKIKNGEIKSYKIKGTK
ncbi:hypothetical protein [Helicobacter sp. T3_23-1059]